MKRDILIIISLVIWTIPTFCQTVSPDTIAAYMWRQTTGAPQEKLYTQTDRGDYIAGDTIWMRHHVVDALTLVPTLTSRYVYVELLNPNGELVRRIMMRQDENGAIHGYMPTQPDMPSGEYTIRSYTRYIADTTPDYIFMKTLRIRNVLENSVKITPTSHNGDLMLTFTDPKTGKNLSLSSLTVTSNKGEVAFTGNTHEGIKIHSLDIGGKQRCLLVKVGNYEEFVPVKRERIDVQLMPEGGHIVMHKLCRVAYKVVDRYGKGVDVTATVTDDIGNIVAETKTLHLGMGMFYITAQTGRSYKITCTTTDGQTIVENLPKANTQVPSLSITQNNGNIIANVVMPDIQTLTNDLWIVVHQGGAPLYIQPMKSEFVKFDRKMFRDGIANILLTDNKMNIISERIVFVWKGNEFNNASNTLAALPETENTRHMQLTLSDSVNASCAVSITATEDACADTAQDIVSTLLLSQEIKGYIEQPAWYFAERGRNGYLDMLMLTQGWRRYDMQKVLKGVASPVASHPETSMSISGKVTSNVTPVGRKGASVTMSSTNGGLAESTTTDKNGMFRFDGFELPDSTGYMLIAHSAKGSTNNVLQINHTVFPKIPADMPMTVYTEHGNTKVAKTDADRIAHGHGGRIMFLPEVEVSAKHIPKTEYESMAKIYGKSINEDALMKEGNKSLLDVLKWNTTGLFYNNAKEWFFYHNKPSFLVIDGTVWNTGRSATDTLSLYQAQNSALQSIRTNNVLQVDILKGPMVGTLPVVSGKAGAMGMDLSAIIITTKSKTENADRNVALVRPIGYQRPVAFYNPKYEAPEDYALRQTVYWNPTLLIKDGKASVRFLANGAKRYRVTVEGVDSKGTLIHLQKEIE